MTEDIYPYYLRTCPACGIRFLASCPEGVCQNFYCSGKCADSVVTTSTTTGTESAK